jgi:hypothetical protein
LDSLLDNNNHSSFYLLYYKRGLANARRRSDVLAQSDLQFFLDRFKGSNFIKAANQKLAWVTLLKGDTAGYKMYIKNCALTGVTLNDEDKDAQMESESGIIPNIYLLNARVLFDGGYYMEALAEITNRTIEDFPTEKDRLEVMYRIARIMDMLDRKDQAVKNYEAVIRTGTNSKYYFAANSSLMLGNIYEKRGDISKATYYYKLCLSMHNTQYKNSIDQKAKSGLVRITNQEKLRVKN